MGGCPTPPSVCDIPTGSRLRLVTGRSTEPRRALRADGAWLGIHVGSRGGNAVVVVLGQTKKLAIGIHVDLGHIRLGYPFAESLGKPFIPHEVPSLPEPDAGGHDILYLPP